MAYTLSKYERETIISFNEEETEAVLYTASPIMMRKMDKLVKKSPDLFRELPEHRQYLDGQLISTRYSFPKDLITIRSRKVKMDLTEEQRAKLRERFKKSQNQI